MSEFNGLDGQMSGLAHRVRSTLIVAAVLVLTNSCASTVDQSAAPREFQARDAAEVFAAGYDNIREYYLEPVQIGSVALHGMQGLQGLDPAVSVSSGEEKVRLSVGRAVIGEFPAPREDDSVRWGMLTAAVILAGRSSSPELAKTPPEQLYRTVFEASFKDLDRFSRYADYDTARDNRAQREGFGGIGVSLLPDEQKVVIANVMPETPAARGGLKAGDEITQIDDQPVQGMSSRDVVNRLRGVIGTPVALTLHRPVNGASAETLNVSVRRARIVPTTVTFERVDDIAHIRMNGFNQDTTASLSKAMIEAWREIGPRMAGVILDLRGNPGGLLDQAVSVADMFIPTGEIISTRGRHPHSMQRYDARSDDIAQGLPMVVLINGASASASEIVAAALQDTGRALVIGTRSFGKGSVQTVIRLPNEGEMTLTWARLFAPSGYALSTYGVLPTVCTANYTDDPVQVISDLRRGTVRPSALLNARRVVADLDANRQKELREACPSKPAHNESIDLDVARLLVHDPELLTRMREMSVVAVAQKAQ